MAIPTPDAVWSLATRHLGRCIHVYDCLDSTNTLALALSDDPARHGLVLLAREQTAGRGQLGRCWQAPPGSSVLMSVLLFPPPPLRRPALLTAWAAVSVCETIHRLTKLQAKIKWPNDVLIHGKKVCGILIEQRSTGQAEFPLATALGIGLNLTQTPALFAAAGLPHAGSLHGLSGVHLTHEDAAKALIGVLDASYHALIEGDCQPLEDQWKSRLGLLEKDVVVTGLQDTQCGRLLDVTLDRVTIATAAGTIMSFVPESIRHLDAVAD
jgi:BirA family transcriptional regulator, biotin operon repressor / biotin---[acetyl-CoA-carboxylase] ligase